MNRLRRAAVHTFASLAVRNYRLYFTGQVVSVSGSWVQRIAQAWLVLHLTGSGIALGLVFALQFLPILVLGAWGGLLADRLDKRRLLLGTQSLMGLVALTLGLVTLAGTVRIWMVYLLALALGLVTAVDNPTRQAFVMEMVGRERVTNAVSLNSAVFTSARAVGPALAGLLINAVGLGWCFVLNAVSFGAVVAALAAMDARQLQRGSSVVRGRGQLLEGLRHAWQAPSLRVPLLALAVVATLALNFSVVLPLLARYSFYGDAATFGVLFSVMGLGSLVGALLTASRRQPTWRLLLGSLAAFGALMLAAAGAPWLWLELAVLFFVGLAAIAFQATANSMLQLHSAPRFRGRVMALYSVVFLGTTPVGAPLVGWVSERFGPRAGLALGGMAVLAVAAAVGAWLVHTRAGPDEERAGRLETP